jgi:hypothetical protein
VPILLIADGCLAGSDAPRSWLSDCSKYPIVRLTSTICESHIDRISGLDVAARMVSAPSRILRSLTSRARISATLSGWIRGTIGKARDGGAGKSHDAFRSQLKRKTRLLTAMVEMERTRTGKTGNRNVD